MLIRYRVRAEATTKQALAAKAGHPMAQLRQLLEAPQRSDEAGEAPRMELAIRLWAKRSNHVMSMLRKIFRARNRILAQLLADARVPKKLVQPLSRLLDAVGFQLWTRDDLGGADRTSLIDLVIDTVVQLARGRR